MAPDVPKWPGAAAPGAMGDSWPGAAPRSAARPGAGVPKSPALTDDIDDGRSAGGVAGILFPAVTVLALVIAVGLWVYLDGAHRTEQMVALVGVVVVALVALGVSAWRHRS